MDPTRPSATPITAAVAGGSEPPYDGGMEHRMTALEARLDLILPTLATKADFESLRMEFEKSTLSNKADVDSLRVEIERSALRADVKFAELRSDMHKMNAEIRSWTLATMATIIGTMLIAIFGISQIYKGASPPAPASQAAQPAPAM